MKINIAAIMVVVLGLIGIRTPAQESKPKGKIHRLKLGAKSPILPLKMIAEKILK